MSFPAESFPVQPSRSTEFGPDDNEAVIDDAFQSYAEAVDVLAGRREYRDSPKDREHALRVLGRIPVNVRHHGGAHYEDSGAPAPQADMEDER